MGRKEPSEKLGFLYEMSLLNVVLFGKSWFNGGEFKKGEYR